jgi:regulator of protease activity HflC (stomatin/prohibitin superfamily)
MGLDKLIDFIIQQINELIPFYFVYEYQGGARFFCGRYKGELKPGLSWKIPWLHTMMRENIIDTTMLLASQSVVSNDKVELVVRGSIGYKIIDVPKYFLNVYDTKSALGDNAMVTIKDTISLCSYEQISDMDIQNVLEQDLRSKVDKYGIEINFFTLTDCTKGRSYRLFNESINLMV